MTSVKPKRVRRKPPIVSSLADVPTIFDVVETMGEESKRFVTLESMYSTAVTNLPADVVAEISTTYTTTTMNYQSRYDRIAHTLKDFFRGITVVRSLGEEKSWIPFAEIHRPKVEGCTATYKQSYTGSSDFSVSVKVFGLGGGVGKTRQYGFADSTELSGECLELTLPVTINWEECRSIGGTIFQRSSVKDIGKDYKEIELTARLDNCRCDPQVVEKNNWQVVRFDIPKATTRKRSLFLEAGQGAEFSLATKINVAEIGPKVVVKYLKRAEYSYTLIGPHNYVAYLPKNKVAYYWNWN